MYGQPLQFYDQSQAAFYNQPQPMYAQPAYGQSMYGQPMQPVMKPVMQPMYMQTPTPTVQQSPIIIINDNKDPVGMHCQTCGLETGQIQRKTVGCVAITWGVVYCLLTGMFCFLPCIQDNYKDTEIVCIKCQTVKHTIPADCFWFFLFFILNSLILILRYHLKKEN